MLQKFKFSIEISSTMPGCWIEETFSGSCYLTENDDDDPPVLELLYRNDVQIDFPPNGVSPHDWEKFEKLCIQNAIETEWLEFIKK